MRIRRDARKLATWDPILLWYAKAIVEMQKRPIKDPTSWRYQSAIHDYVAGQDPLAQPGEALPSAGDQKSFWQQCQHGSWFFLPWHRIYLFYFEQIVTAAIVKLGGPSDWALPYWNYSDGNNADSRRLPAAFIAQQMPDGSKNPLLVQARDEGNDGNPVGDANDVDIKTCLGEAVFPAASTGGDPGFGGPQTAFQHSGGVTGSLEATPHGNMHVRVGGWMAAFETAPLDPIFWLHHANIDRLWNVWRQRDPGHVNPGDSQWLTGVSFQFHDAQGSAASQTSSQVVDSTASPLLYKYEDESDPLAAQPTPSAVPRIAMAERPIPEMVGASSAPVTLTGQPAHAQMVVHPPSGPAREARAAGAPPRKIYLNIENVTGSGRARVYSVYLNVPEGSDPASHAELYAGDLPMFGVVEASRADARHPGTGLHYRLDVTTLVQALESKGAWDPQKVRVSFAPKPWGSGPKGAPRASDHEIHVGRVSLYYA